MSRFLADGAYDGTGVFNALTTEFGSDVEVIIPPPKSATLGLFDQRDAHIEGIAELQIGAKALNRITSLGRAMFEPV